MGTVYGPLERNHQRSEAYYDVEYHRRFSLPISCLCIGVLAMTLGVQPSRGGHHWGASANIAVGVVCIFAYYLLFALGEALGRNLVILPWVGMWTPNIVFGILSVILFRQVGTERWLAVSEAFAEWYVTALVKLKLIAAPDMGT
jgi:lipopolysaccharide export system permease protein